MAGFQPQTGAAAAGANVLVAGSALFRDPEGLGHATAEISLNAQKAAGGTKQVADETQALTRVVGETSQSASQVLAVSNDMNDQASRLREVVERFISQVMAA